MLENLVGQTLDRYRLQRIIWNDRLSTIFKAQDPTLQRDVAVQIILPEYTTAAGDFGERFSRAARTVAQFDHPNLVQIFNFGEAQTYFFLILEYLAGDSLGKLLSELEAKGRWIPLREAVFIVQQLALALEYIHSQGGPQLQINPARIMLKPVQSEGLPYLPVIADLGLNQLLRVEADEDPAYISPEGALGRVTDSRSDVYRLGVLLFELATGQLPFPIENQGDAVRYHTRQPLPPPRSLRSDLPAELEAILVRAMEKNPEARYSSPAEFVNDLKRISPKIEAIASAPPAFVGAVSLLEPYRESLGKSRHMAEFEETIPPPATTVRQAAPPDPGNVEVYLESVQVSVQPGDSAIVRLFVAHQGTAAAVYRIVVEGLPENWVTVTPQVVQLAAGERKDVSIMIRPPRLPASRAGRYSFMARAINQQAPARFAEVRAALTVAAFSGFSSHLYEPRLKSQDTGQVGINNQGNTQEVFTIQFRDARNQLAFNPPQAQLRLVEGQAGAVEYRADVRRLRWFGSEEALPYSVQISSSAGEMQTHHGEYTSQPLLPVWVLGVITVLFLCLASTVALFLVRANSTAGSATATFVAEQTGTADAYIATLQSGTATALWIAGANQATLDAATATAFQLQTATIQAAATTQAAETAVAAANQTATAQSGAQAAATQTAAAQTAAVQGATQAAVNQTATAQAAAAQTAAAQTAAAQQNAAATATAIAVQTAQAAAVAQTQAAQTAVAQTATAEAQQQAANQTATAQAAATQTAAANVRVAYIYLNDPNRAADYQSLLQGSGVQVDLITQQAITTTDFSPFRAILIGPDTGREGEWGDPAGAQANRLATSGIHLLGLGDGGFALFGRYSLPIGWQNGVSGTTADAQASDPANPVWTTPNSIDLPEGGVITLFDSGISYNAANIQPPPANIVEIARPPGDPAHAILIRLGSNVMLWGFNGGPTDMTSAGQQLFVNLLRSLIP